MPGWAGTARESPAAVAGAAVAGIGIGRYQEQARASARRHGELLRLQSLARDSGNRRNPSAGRQPGELGTSARVGPDRSRRARADELDRLIRQVVGERAFDDADDDGADRDVGDRQRDTGNRLGIHLSAD